MATIELWKPLLENSEGIRTVNFFNGRLLTGNDLKSEQQAQRDADQQLGIALGAGIARGLEVSDAPASTKQDPVVTVKAGLAINRLGQTLAIKQAVDVRIVPQQAANTTKTGEFGTCEWVSGEPYIAGPRLNVLTIAPAKGNQGSAQVSGLDPVNVRCNSNVQVETVQFRLLPFSPTLLEELQKDDPELQRLRNRLAYRCFGADQLAKFLTDPFGTDASSFGLLDTLSVTGYTEADVPLAILYLTATKGLVFVDNWPVRRRLCAPDSSPTWSPLLGDRRRTEGEAMFLQFQDHIDALWKPRNGRMNIKARDVFDYLPPVGILPVIDDKQPAGFDPEAFFSGLTTRGPMFIDEAKLEYLIRCALAFPPIAANRGELIWTYKVVANATAIASKTGNPHTYLVFASGHMPYLADARLDTARSGYSNLALDR